MKAYAFFDVDGTIVNMTTMISFLAYVQKHHRTPSARHAWSIVRWQLSKRILSREAVNKLYYRIFGGLCVAAINEFGEKWFDDLLHREALILNAQVVSLLRQHQAAQHEVVFVSGSFLPCLAPLANHLNVNKMLCVRPLVVGGCFTGEIESPQTIGQGKADAIVQYLREQGSSLENCLYAYGDHMSDLPMLRLAKHPTAVIGDPGLKRYATRHDWRILSGESSANDDNESITTPATD